MASFTIWSKEPKINYVHAERPAAAVHEGARAGAAENGARDSPSQRAGRRLSHRIGDRVLEVQR